MGLLEPAREGAAPFTPQIVLPAQLAPRSRAGLQPECRLMLAVLEDAVWTLLRSPRGGPGNERLAAEAEEWLASDDTAGPFTFVNVCHALDLEVGSVRAAVARERLAVAAGAGARARPSPFRRMTGGRGLAVPRARRRGHGASPRR
ncbi:MAG TPA: hypothetical protein VKW76_13600 [Candidatus Binatia bacterium]|nr:hypothetical protein [Candidatus Binatia bacterium]